MKKSIFWLIIIFIFLTTYKPKSNFILNIPLNIKEIIIENNLVIDTLEIKQELAFLYERNLFFLDVRDIAKSLKNISFIESISIKKIYPNKLNIIIVEKKPIAILQNKIEKNYISNKGELVIFKDLKIYNDLPTVFGNNKAFYSLYQDLKNIKFPLGDIKSFYFFESGRWDLIMEDDKVLKLPIKGYIISLDNFMKSRKNNSLNKYKIFDYRISDQLILN